MVEMVISEQIRKKQSTRPPVFKLPEFQFENFAVDLQHIYTGDMVKDREEIFRTIELAINLCKQKLSGKGRVAIDEFANFHAKMRVAFVQVIHVDVKDLKAIALKPVIPVIIPGKDDKIDGL